MIIKNVKLTIKVGGDKFDQAIVSYMKKQHNLLIGERTAEKVKIEIGCAYKREKDITMEIVGRNLITGLPYKITVSSFLIIEYPRDKTFSGLNESSLEHNIAK